MLLKKHFNYPLIFWFSTAFISGFVILSLEMLGFRLLAPHFGYSTYVWGGLLGSIMATLSLGYFFGGNLADLKPKGTLALDFILLATGYLIFIALSYKIILEMLTGWGIVFGSIMGSIILFGPPMILLGMIPPFLIRLMANEKTIGSISGKIFAVSTWGSLLGTFLTSFILIPEYGSFKTLVGLILILSVLYFTGNFSKWWRAITGVGIIIFTLFLPGEQTDGKIVYQTESAYNLIQVKKIKNLHTLILNGGIRAHSIYRKGLTSTGSYYDFMLLGPFLTQSKNLLILGMGAGTSLRQFQINFPNLHIDAVEIDPKIVAVGKQFFDWSENSNLNIFIEDARPFLDQTTKQYDLIEVDIFKGGPFIPFYLSTQEFFSQIKKKLAPKGWMMMNVITGKENRLFSDSLGKTVNSVFSKLYILDLGGNLLFLAPKYSIHLDELRTILKTVSNSPLKILSDHALEHIHEFKTKANSIIFIDDKAPTEKLIYDLVKNEYR